MIEVSDRKYFTDWLSFVTDLKTARTWAKTEIDDTTGTAKFFDNTGNYIEVTWASNNLVVAPYTKGGVSGNVALNGGYIWYVKTNKAFAIFATTASGNNLASHKTNAVIFTTQGNVDVIVYKGGSSSTLSTIALFDETFNEGNKTDRDFTTTLGCYKAVAYPVCCQTSTVICDNVLILINNPFTVLINSEITLDGKSYYMVGNLLLAD